MKAAVCRAFDAPLEIADIDIRPPGPGEVEVAIAACAVCHSDIHGMDGAWGGYLPAVYGHEAAGNVTAIGEGITDIAKGDPVLVTPIRACGTCPSCAGGHPATCETPYDRVGDGPLRGRDGTPIEQGISAAAFAERVVVDRSQIQTIPADIGMDAACLLSCGVITGIGAVTNTADVKPGSDVVVVGAGGVGLNSIQGAAIAGAARVIAVDPVPEKLDGAREFGATDVVLATDDDVEHQIGKLTGGRGADIVLVTVGAADAYRHAPRFLAPRGQLIAVGMPPADAWAEWSPGDVSYLGQAIRGSCLGDTVLSRDIPALVALYRQGRLKLDELVTGRYPLARINDAIDDTRAGRSRRNVILFDGDGR